MIHPVLLLHGWLLAGPPLPQEPPSREEQSSAKLSEDPTQRTLANATSEARDAWEALCGASVGDSTPITAFHIEAHVKNRGRERRNEGEVAYRFLAPHCVRFRISEKTEVGRSGRRKADYWMRDGGEVLTLDKKDYKADRESIRDMAALARNYIALSDPGRLRLHGLEVPQDHPMEAMPVAGNRRSLKKLKWLRITSPDFALPGGEQGPLAGESLYRVDLGLRPETHELAWTPEIVIVRSLPAPGEPEQSFLLKLENYKEKDGFRIPHEIAVHHRDEELSHRPFQKLAAQEITIREIDLRAKLGVKDFRP